MLLNIEATKKILAASSVPEYFYVLPGGFDAGDSVGIRQIGSIWEVFYSERGRHDILLATESEDAACRFLLQKIDAYLQESEGRSLPQTW